MRRGSTRPSSSVACKGSQPLGQWGGRGEHGPAFADGALQALPPPPPAHSPWHSVLVPTVIGAEGR